MSTRYFDLFGNGLARVCLITKGIGAVFLVAMMLITFFDVLLRNVMSLPITGTYELTELFMILIVYLGVAHAQLSKAHISVDLFMSLVPRRGQAAIDTCTSFLSMGIFMLITWRSFDRFQYLLKNETESDMLSLPLAYFQMVIVIGCGLLSLALLKDVIYHFTRMIRNGS